MPYISNSELESRMKAARKRRQQEEDAYIKGATEVAGWETGESNAQKLAAEEAEKNKGFWQKAGDKAKAVGKGIAESYTSLGNTLGTIAAAPGINKQRDEHQKAQEALMKQLSDINRQRFGENEGDTPLSVTDPAKDAKLKKQFDSINAAFKAAQDDYDWWDKQVGDLSVKKSAGDIASITTDVLSAGTYGAATKGAKTMRLAKAANVAEKGGVPLLKTVGKGAATGAAWNVGGDAVQQALDEKEGYDLKQAATQGGLGAVLGGLGAGVEARGINKKARALEEADRAMMNKVDSGVDDVVRGMDAEDKIRADLDTTNKPLQLDSGQGRMQRRLDEIDAELDGLRKGETDPNAYATDTENIQTLAGEPAGNPKLTKTGEPYKNTKAGTFAETTGRTVTDSTDTATRARELMRERAALQNEIDGLESISKFDGVDGPKLDVNDPQFKQAVDNEIQAVDNSIKFKDKQTKKVNSLVDYFRTPKQVLNKIGLSDTAKVVETSFENYRRNMMSDFKLLKGWEQRASAPGASERIFNYLDGQGNKLTGEELKVANEMKAHFKDWADKLGIPEEQRVSDYITHIFDGDFDGKTTDVTLNSILDRTGTSKVYNPFTQKRLGKAGYKTDAFAAMEAYMKKATRQFNMDPALKITADAAKNVDDRTARYILSLNKAIAMKPGKVEQALNDVVASVIPRAGEQGATRAMRAWRNTVYRATLGINVGSALRNLTQGTNTFAELGARDTLKGYSQLMRTFGQAAEQKASGKAITAWDELTEHGILGDAFHQQDRNYTTLKSTLQKADKGLWAMFDTAERINRGSAYFGAKAKALRKGMSEAEAIEYAKDVVGKTQFRFNDIETPLVLRSQVAKTLGQFQSFNIKQAEFLAGTAKGALKGDKAEIAKAVRWIAANMAIASTVGSVLGLKWYDAVPDFGTFRGVRSPLLDAGQAVKSVLTGKDEYGQEQSRGELAVDAAKDLFGLTVPGGTQIKKTYEGVDAYNRGDSRTESGKIRYTIDNEGELFPGATAGRAALFGQYNLDQGQEYFGAGREAFTDKQTEVIDAVPSGEEAAYEDFFRNMGEKYDSKQNTANKIREEIKNKNFAKAKRLADEHNAQVEEELRLLGGKVGRPSKDIVDYIRSSYKVNFDYYKRNPKGNDNEED